MARPPVQAGVRVVAQMGLADAAEQRLHSLFRKGWKVMRVDPSAAQKPDLVSNLSVLPKLKDASHDAVWSSYALARMVPGMAQRTLKEWRRVLKPGGMLVLALPDLLLAAEVLAGARRATKENPLLPKGANARDLIYGHALAAKTQELGLLFKTGFTPDAIGHALKAAGFTTVRVLRDKGEMTVQAFRPGPGIVPNDTPTIHNASQKGLPDELDQEPVEWKTPGF